MQKRLKKGLGDDCFSFILSMPYGRCHSFNLMWEVIDWYWRWFSIKPHGLKATHFHMGVFLFVVQIIWHHYRFLILLYRSIAWVVRSMGFLGSGIFFLIGTWFTSAFEV